MKLYLSSYKMGNKIQELKKWLKSSYNNKICLVSNSRDVYPDGERKIKGLQNDSKDLEELGFAVIHLDLKSYFGKKEKSRHDLQEIKAFYVIGGNTFVLRKAMMLSGFDDLLLEYSNDPSYLYAGYSAGICCLSENMRALAIMDDPHADPYNCNLPAFYSGVGLVEETLIPHFKSNHAESKTANKAVQYCKEHGISYQTIRDGDVIIRKTTHWNGNY